MDDSTAAPAAPDLGASSAAPAPSIDVSAVVPVETQPPSYELALPDGLQLPEGALDGIKQRFAAANLTTEQAQALFDGHIEGLQSGALSHEQRLNDNWATTKAAWESQIKADPEIGGNKLERTLSQIRTGSDVLLGEKAANALRQALDLTGAGSHPAVVKALAKAFAIHAPPTQVMGSPPTPTQRRSAGSTLYPSQGGE